MKHRSFIRVQKRRSYGVGYRCKRFVGGFVYRSNGGFYMVVVTGNQEKYAQYGNFNEREEMALQKL